MSKMTWPSDFGPSFTPAEMLERGVFEGRYIGGIKGQPAVPKDWYSYERVLSGKDKKQYPPDPEVNYFKIKSRQPLSVWKENGWLTVNSPNGWFEWYIKFCLGRRLGNITVHGKSVNEDHWQINRWRSFVARHMGQVASHCKLSDRECHTKQRQGLLQWGWDSQRHHFTDKQVQANAAKISRKLGFELTEISIENLPSLEW